MIGIVTEVVRCYILLSGAPDSFGFGTRPFHHASDMVNSSMHNNDVCSAYERVCVCGQNSNSLGR